MSEERHYSAFISYRHVPRDIEVARHIQQKLERFKAPKQIAEKYGISRFDKLFRDQEELEIGSDLSAKIKYALEHSDHLIVICSPEYNESKWCQLEVESFLKSHDHDHVFCVLSSGEPPAIFPKILYDHAEPLGCDYRGDLREADRIELPRLESAMIGCTYDELVMRQERYRKKRLTIILSCVMAAAAIIISYLLYSNALISRNYALSQINESRLLAKESLTYLSKSDRYEALNSALKAIEGDRPQTDDALYALALASNAYQTPYHYSETWRVDLVGDIDSMMISRDGRYLVCKGSDGVFHTIDMSTHEEVAFFEVGSDVLSFEEAKDRQLIAYADGSLKCVDILNGELIFETPMKYRSIGISKVSPSGRYIATADSFAVQICDEAGEPYMSLPLPEEQDGYITDLFWSKDEHYIAVKLRLFDRTYCIGLFDLETYAFHLLSDNCLEILSFGFLDDGRLYVLSDDNVNRSYKGTDSYETYKGVYDLEIYDPIDPVFVKKIQEDSVSGNCLVVENEGKISLILSDKIYRFDEDYEETGSFSLPDTAVEVLYHSGEYINVVCANGYNGTIFYEAGNASFVSTFPENCDEIKIGKGSDLLSDAYVVRKDGDLHIYEGSYDEQLKILSDKGFDHPESSLLHEDDLYVKANDVLYLYRLSQDGDVLTIDLEKGNAWHLLKAYEDKIAVLKIDGRSGKLFVRFYSGEDGSLLEEIDTSLYNIYLASGILSYPLDRSEAVFLDASYDGFSSLCLDGDILSMHDENDSRRIVMIDLSSLERKDYVAETDLLYNGMASPILVLDEGRKILTYTDNGVLFMDVESEEEKVLSENNGGRALADGDDVLAYSCYDHIDVSSLSGDLLYRIDHFDHDVISLKVFADRVYCIGDDHVLRIYENGERIRNVDLSFADMAYSEYSSFRYEFYEDRLYLFSDTALEVISLSSDSTMPVYYIADSVLGFDEGERRVCMYSYDPSRRDNMYYPAVFEEYDGASLIDKAKGQVADFR